jgi:hypothetical protein
VAILPGPPALNHIAFDVSSVDELMRGLARMHENGIKLSWGPGRHTAGNNTFSYFITPNGNAVEYTSDLEEVDETTWQPQVYEPGPSTIDQWGTVGSSPATCRTPRCSPTRACGRSRPDPPAHQGSESMIGKALVVGGGVGGMSAALALARQGVQVELVDADPEWRAYGAGISVTGLSLRAFDDLGILDDVRAKGFVGGGIRLRAVDGSVIMETPPIPEAAPPVARSGGIMRPALHEIMSSRVREQGVRVTLGQEIANVEQDATGATVSFPDGREERFDLVVAADGIFSSCASRCFPRLRVRSSPARVAGGSSPSDRPKSTARRCLSAARSSSASTRSRQTACTPSSSSTCPTTRGSRPKNSWATWPTFLPRLAATCRRSAPDWGRTRWSITGRSNGSCSLPHGIAAAWY